MLITHRAASGAALAHALADVLAVAVADPFAAEVVAVPAKGVERWIAQRLSHVLGAPTGDGVCANVEFPWPSTLVDEALAASSAEHAEAVRAVGAGAGGVAAARRHRRVDPGRAVVPVARPAPRRRWRGQGTSARGGAPAGRAASTSTASRGRRCCAPGRPAATSAATGRRWTTTCAGRPSCGAACANALGTPSPAELLDDACARLRDEPELSDLPARISVFGASRLSPARLQVLAALAEHRDVHLWLHHASPALWDTVAAAATCSTPPRRRGPRPPHQPAAHQPVPRRPRAAAAGRPLRARQPDGRCTPPAPVADTLLGRLKHDLADDRVPDRAAAARRRRPQRPGARLPRPHPPGRGAARGPRRPARRRPDPRAARRARHVPRRRDVRADHRGDLRDRRRGRRRAPGGAGCESGWPTGRCARPTRCSPCCRSCSSSAPPRLTASPGARPRRPPAVRQRFGFDDDELERLRDWTVGAGVRWGLDAEHRETWQLGDLEQGTWRDGLDRLLLGVAMEGSARQLAATSCRSTTSTAPTSTWPAGSRSWSTGSPPRQALMAGRHTASRLAGRARRRCQRAGRHDVRHRLAAAAAARRARRHRRGRRRQHRVARPRRRPRPARGQPGRPAHPGQLPHRHADRLHAGADALGAAPRGLPARPRRRRLPPAEQPRRRRRARPRPAGSASATRAARTGSCCSTPSCAAAEHLVITYTGADERTGAPVPPAVPLGELLDALDRTASTVDRAPGA